MLKAMQREPSWSYVSHFIIYFSHFSFSVILQAFFRVRRKLVSLHNHSISQALLQGFKQLWNNSFIFNSSAIIHSFVAFSCCWSMLLCPGFRQTWKTRKTQGISKYLREIRENLENSGNFVWGQLFWFFSNIN